MYMALRTSQKNSMSPILDINSSHIVNILARRPQDMRMRMQDRKDCALQLEFRYASEETWIDAF